MSVTVENARERFEFGENWSRFLAVLDEERIAEAEKSLQRMLGLQSLEGHTFLDIGSGSGLFSLAAARLGAPRVHSFDVDASSVGCTRELKRRFLPHAHHWTIERASALERDYIETLGAFDIVYSWGVLHHTGDMYQALENTVLAVRQGGRIFVSIYNDQGLRSHLWRWVKRTYNRLPRRLRMPFVAAVMAPREAMIAGFALVSLKPLGYVRSWTEYKQSRGMSRWHDYVDWVGGYPFEVATPDAIFGFLHVRGFELEELRTCGGGLGCNEFVFVRRSS